MGPPPGVSDADCGTVEMLLEPHHVQARNVFHRAHPAGIGRAQYAYFRPSEEELETLRNGGFIELCQYGSVVQPFSAAVWPPSEHDAGDDKDPSC